MISYLDMLNDNDLIPMNIEKKMKINAVIILNL